MNIIDVLLRVNDRLNPKLKEIPSNLSAGVLAGNLMTQAFNTMFETASRGIESIGKAISKGIEAEQSVILTASEFANAMSVSFEDAEQYIVRLQGRFAELAASLPGETEDYVQFFRTIGSSIAMINTEMNNGFFDAQSYQKQIDTIVSRFIILGNRPGINKIQRDSVLPNLFTEGQTLKGLFQASGEFFQKNPAFKTGIIRVLGDRDLKDLTNPEKLELVTKALEEAISPETLARLGQTLSGNIELLKTKLFDPTLGLFSVQRDLDGNLNNGVQNIIQTLKAVTNSLFVSEKSLFGSIQNLLNKLGITFADPSKQLDNVLQKFNKWIQRTTQFIDNLASQNLELDRVTDILSDNIFDFITNQFGNFIEDAIPALFDSAIEGLAFIFDSVFSKDGKDRSDSIITSVFKAIDKMINIAFDAENIGTTFKAIGLVFAVFIGGTIVTALAALASPIVLAIGAIAVTVGGIIYANADKIGKLIDDVFTNIISGINKFVNAIELGWTKSIDFFGDAIQKLIYNLGLKLNRILPDFLDIKVQAPITSSAFRFGGGRADGNFPSGSSLLMQAAIAESKKSPPGSSVVVANTSELILNTAQQANLLQSLQRPKSANSLTIQNLIVQTSSENPEALADKIVRSLEVKWNQFNNSKLSSNY